MKSLVKKNNFKFLFRLKMASISLLKIVIFTGLFFYLGYHLITGKNGVINYFKEKARYEHLSQELKIVEERKESLENKAYKLHQKSLDADLLDEQYRRTTGNIKPNEVIYYLDK